MKIYKVQSEEKGTPLYCIDWIDVLEYMGEKPLLISIVEMSPKEYDARPEFAGF